MFKPSIIIFALVMLCMPAAAQSRGHAPDPKTGPPEIRSDVDPPSLVDPSDFDMLKKFRTDPRRAGSERMPADPKGVVNARPFSSATGYLSVPGAYRYLTYDRTGTWLTLDQSTAQVINEVLESATR